MIVSEYLIIGFLEHVELLKILLAYLLLSGEYCDALCAFLLDNSQVIVKALIYLHNFILTKEGIGGRYCPNNLLDCEVNGIVQPGAWRNENISHHIQKIHRTGSNNSGRAVMNLRNVLRDYVNSEEGAVEWQWDRAFHNININ